MIDFSTDIDVMKVELSGGSAQTIIQDVDYDPDGSIEVDFEDSYYFDANTGYLIKEHWYARCKTSVGDFTWKEDVKITDSSFRISKNLQVTQNRYIQVFTIVIVLISLPIIFYLYQRFRWSNS